MPKLERPTYLMAKFLLGIMIWWLNHVQLLALWRWHVSVLATSEVSLQRECVGGIWRESTEPLQCTRLPIWLNHESFFLLQFGYVFFFYLQKDFRDLCIPQRIWIEFSWWCRMTREWDTFGGIKISPTLLGSGQEWTCCFVVLPGMLHPLRLRSARACGHHPDFGDEKGGFLRKGAIGSVSKIVDRRGLFGGLQARYFVYMQCTSCARIPVVLITSWSCPDNHKKHPACSVISLCTLFKVHGTHGNHMLCHISSFHHVWSFFQKLVLSRRGHIQTARCWAPRRTLRHGDFTLNNSLGGAAETCFSMS